MAKLKIYKLHFTSPLHIGDKREDYSISLKTIPSDTMYAAITSCLAKLGKEIPVDGNLGASISSLFPYYQKTVTDNPVYFFPKPLIQRLPNLKDVGKAKLVKKATWLDKDYFEKVLNGTNLFDNNDEDVKSIQGPYVSSKKIDEKFMQSQVLPRVMVSRTQEEDAKPYYIDRVSFKGESGLYFLAYGDTSLIDQGMELLKVEGIGTDRNVGNGFFEFTTDEIELKLPENTQHIVSLSLFIPKSKEQLSTLLNSEKVAYDIVRRGGWITTPPFNSLRKNVINALSEGSVFSTTSSHITIMGRIVDLRPDTEFEPKVNHPIWRSGISIMLPIKL